VSDRDELARQNQALNEQVKLLVRTEKRLYSAQRTIEAQLDRINLLNRFALASNQNVESGPILQLFLELLLDVLRADQAVALLVDEGDTLVVAADKQLSELPPSSGTQRQGFAAGGFSLGRPLVVDVTTEPPPGISALLAFVAEHFDGASAGGRESCPPKAEVVIPFQQRDGRLLGVVVLRTLEALHFNDQLPSSQDLPFLELARMHLESALQNVFLLQETARKASLDKELEVARTVQEALVPPADVIAVGRVSLAGFFEPASTCGGDVWTWKHLSKDRVLLLIGDVTGHGVPAALIAAVVLGAAELLPPDVTPAGALTLLNQAVYRAGKGKLLMSCFVIVMDVASGELSYAGAGHPAPFVLRRLGDKVAVGSLVARGSQLGEAAFLPSPVGHATIAPGDLLLLFSDGITECQDAAGELWGERRLRRAITRAAQAEHDAGEVSVGRFRGELARALGAFAGKAERSDDMTFVVAAYT
jgi:serine phosphatase RsbU (regulator of sigma subunit)